MSHKFRKCIKGKDGFTLTEMIIVVAIIGILTGLVTVGIMGYMKTAYMNRVNETAKTVFLATQNYLTEEKQMGKLESFNRTAESYGGEVSKDTLEKIFTTNDESFSFSDYEQKYGTENIRYILLKEGDGNTKSDNPIYTIVKEYLQDEEVLSHTFLIEYDTKSGVVRSVFYTEKADTFTYDGNMDSKENVIKRDSKSLKDKRQGYYGVNTTSLLQYNLDLYSPKNIKLVNGERLYAEWTESNYLSPDELAGGVYHTNLNEAFDNAELRNYLAYDVEVYRIKESGDEKVLTIQDITKADSKGTTLAQAEEAVTDNGLVIAYNPSSNTWQLLLDCLHHSIFDMFGTEQASEKLQVADEIQASDMLYCKISVHLQENNMYSGESEPVSTNQQSANFAGGAKTFSPTGLAKDTVEVYGNGYLNEDGSSNEDGKAYSISNVRHFNNMRNVADADCFVQRADIDWAKPEADRNVTAGLFIPFKFARSNVRSLYTDIFRGTFRNAGNYKLKNLKIDGISGAPEKNVGIFRQNAGTVQGLYLENAQVSGAYLTGVIAGMNTGVIENVILDNCQVQGSFYTGGITGCNETAGELKNIQCDTTVTALVAADVTGRIEIPVGDSVTYGECIGGIAGVNKGSAQKLVTSITDSKGVAKRDVRTISGIQKVGGIFGSNENTSGVQVTDCVNFNMLKTANETVQTRDFGGIAGFNKKDARLEACVNKSQVFTETAHANPERIKNIGGIAGTNEGSLHECSSVLPGKNDVKNITKDVITKIKNKQMPVYTGVCVGGIAGYNGENGVVTHCSTDTVVTGYRFVGGLIGENRGEFVGGHSYAADGLVVAGKDSAGGIVGTNYQSLMQGYTNKATVIARSLAGGITGANGGSGNYLSELTKGSDTYYEQLLAPEFEHVNAAARIENCSNYGFVLALDRYCGGITGVNFGTVKNTHSAVTMEDKTWLSDKLEDYDYKVFATAECVGGIAGCNLGTISGGNAQSESEVSAIYGDNFVGGISGLNKGPVTNYPRVEGTVYSAGNAVGGFIGLNMNGESISHLAFNDGLDVYGKYFVGGIIGCNVSDGVSNVKIDGATTQASERTGTISGEVYVGGIIGYQTKARESLTTLFVQDLNVRIATAYDAYTPESAVISDSAVTVFVNCSNRSDVKARRYVGGIVGYNSNDSSLCISNSINYGSVSIDDKGDVTDGNYYIGGITGRNSANGVIDRCINDGSVKSPSNYLGGICEVNEGWIQFCSVGKSQNYSGHIEGSKSVGGLVGLNSKYIVQCSTSQYAKITGGDNTGGLAGTNDSNGIITGDAGRAKEVAGITSGGNGENLCICSGSVKGKNNTGGIVGLNQGSVADVSVEGATISGETYVGGFIGHNRGKLITDGNQGDTSLIEGLVNNAKKVIGKHQVGGIVGRHEAVKIQNCKNLGEVEATGSGKEGFAGGITGSVESGITIENCVNYGTVTSNQSRAGGITGNNQGIISNCDNYGSVTGSLVQNIANAIGGIAGVNEGEVKECISGDNQSDPNKEQNPNADKKNKIEGLYLVGGLIGYNKGTLINETRGKTVDISIKAAKEKIGTIGNIGGIIGYVDSGCTDIISDYTYSGTISVDSDVPVQNQYIGGIIGYLRTNMVLENCMFAGKITGYGNGNSFTTMGGVGGLAGRSDGTIIVLSNQDGIYTSNTAASLVEGISNVGGVVGHAYGKHTIKLRTAEGDLAPSEILENQDSARENDIYYVNLSRVSGNTRAGGFYGRDHEDSNQGITLSYYQNGLKDDEEAGRIMIQPMAGREAAAIGGIIGSTYASSSKPFTFVQVRNYGTIGKEGSERESANGVGGIVGNCNNERGTVLTRAYNYGEIICGSKNVGGLAGNSKNTEITDSYNHGNITVCASNVGGLAGTCNNLQVTTTGSQALNSGNITITGNYAYIGGLVGDLNNTTVITNVKNDGNITVTRNTSGDAYIGGIAGKVQGTVQITGCTNNGNMMLSKVWGSGGIAGGVIATSLELTDCENYGEIMNEYHNAGGIIGWMKSATRLHMQDNVNYGTVYAKYRGGGIIGYMQASSGSDWILTRCTNYGEIRGALPYKSDNGWISHLGGCIGAFWSNATVSEFKNYGAVIIEADDEYVKDPIKEIHYCGGIVGHMTGKSVVESGENYGILDFTSLNVATIQGLGGIAGQSEVNSKLLYCTNSASVMGNTAYAADVGGVVGNSQGLVYSCKTQQDGGIRIVCGKRNIGGIIGKAWEASCKVSSIVNKQNNGYEISSNCFKVMGNENVGGIAGAQLGATIYTVVNYGEVNLLKDGVNKSSSFSAGGITGNATYSDTNGKTPGVIANSYNFGRVYFSYDKREHYLGGLVGYRLPRVENEEITLAVAIKDSFYVHESGTNELVSASRPDSKMTSKEVLAIGNEPSSFFYRDKEDQMFGFFNAPELLQAERFRLSADAYKKMYLLLHPNAGEDEVAGLESFNRPETIIENIIPYYDRYKLPVPETQPVVSTGGYSYELPITRMPGFCDRLEIRVYPEDTDYAAIVDGTAASIYSAIKDIKMDNQLQNMGISLNDEECRTKYAGKVLKVALKAYGVKQELEGDGQLTYTQDSDWEVVQEFVVMPMLPAPRVEVVGQEGSVMKFKMTNWSEYQKAAGELYESIQSDAVLSQLEIYQKILNGLDTFTITDYYLANETAGKGGTKDQWVITKEDIDEEGYFVLNYDTSDVFKKNKSNNQWHDWDIKALALNSSDTLEAQAVKASLNEEKCLYRYVNSYNGYVTRYRIEASTKLAKPTSLNSRYLGGTDWQDDVHTPSYEISFNESSSPREAIDYYLVTVTNPQNQKTHTIKLKPQELPEEGTGEEEPQIGPLVYELTKDVLLGDGENQLGVDFSTGSQPMQLQWTVSAHPSDSEAAKYFTTSDDAAASIPLIKKANPVENITVVIKDENTPNVLTFRWEDSYMTGEDTYFVSYEVKRDNETVELVSGVALQTREYTVTLPEADKNYEIVFSVVRQGIVNGGTVISMNSDPETLIQKTGEKLPQVTDVYAELSKVEGTNLYYRLTFNIPENLKADTCADFWIQAVDYYNSSEELLTEALILPFTDSKAVETEIEIPASNAGKQFIVHVVSRSASGIYADSERALSNTVIIPDNTLLPPLEESMKAQMQQDKDTVLDLSETGNAVTRQQLEKASYEFSWEFADKLNNVNNQYIEIICEEQVLYTQTTTKNIKEITVTKDWSDYAGKTMQLLVYNLPQDANLSLPSKAAVLEFTIPRIRVEAPAFTKDKPVTIYTVLEDNTEQEIDVEADEIEAGNYPFLTYHLSWENAENAEGRTGYRIFLYYEEQDENEDVTKVPVGFSVVQEEGTENISVPDGLYTWMNTEEAEWPQNLVLTGIDAQYAGKEIKAEISYCSNNQKEDPENPDVSITEESPVYADSLPAQVVIQMPKQKTEEEQLLLPMHIDETPGIYLTKAFRGSYVKLSMGLYGSNRDFLWDDKRKDYRSSKCSFRFI